MRFPQFWALMVLLIATMVLVHVRGDVDRVPLSVPLSQMPAGLGTWTGQDIPISQDVLDVLGKGIFLNRLYVPQGSSAGASSASGGSFASSGASSAPVGLLIAYFPTQRSGQSIHSPQNCLPGSGWTFESSNVTEFADDHSKTYRVGDYIISNGSQRQEVLYWYQSHGRSIANDYMAKLYMLTDSIRYGRTDAALVRVITPVGQNEDRQQAHARVVTFAKMVAPLLPAYIPN